MEIENITFSESIKLLAERSNIELPDLNDHQKRRYKEREKLFALNKLAAKFFNYLLLEKNMAKKALDYLKERNFTEEDIKKFQIGYAADEWQMLMSFLQKRDYSIELIYKAGLITEGKNNSYYDKFRNRVIFPIFNNRGEVIAFGGRILDDQSDYGPKYLNSPETPIFSKKKNLYGMHLAKEKIRKTDTCIIMEGYTDVIQAHKYGFENSIASLGTSFTEEQARLIKRYAENAFIAYDADTAGNKATLRGLEILSEAGIDVKVIELPVGSDPDQILINKGKEAFKNHMDNASSLVDYKINMIIKDKNLDDPGIRIKVLKSIIDLISDINSDLKREIYIERAADKTDFSQEVLSVEVKKKAKENKRRNSKFNIEKKNSQPKNLYAQLSYHQKIEEQILAYFINNPSLREKIADKITEKDFSGRTAQLAALLFQGKIISGSVKIENIKEQLGDELLSYWSEIIVKQKKGLSEEKILKLADYLSSQRVSENKTKICNLLSDKELSLDKLNKMLLTFYKMNYNSERRD
jgi:DNA primase